jgi:3-deoxy-D-manno-octulosonic-acid transferase
MNYIYEVLIHIYGWLIKVAAVFNAKARKLAVGQDKSLRELKLKVDPNAEYIWFHVASLGEFEQGRPVIESLKQQKPDTEILLTFFSPSGYEIRKDYPQADIVSYLPLDTHHNAKEWLQTIKISKAIFVKYEFWPNFLLALKEVNIPVYSISAKFRPSQLFFKWYGSWYLRLLQSFDHIFVQDKESMQLLLSKDTGNVSVAGDTRFDRVQQLAAQANELKIIEHFCTSPKVIVAGSTWPADEDLLIKYIKNRPEIKLILAPHEIHQSHISSIESKLNCSYQKYSTANSSELNDARCLIIDTIGILSSIYRYGNVAYIGGGFGVGIHNTLEAAVYGVPVIFGPNYKKFREAISLIQARGGFSIDDYKSLEQVLDTTFEPNEFGYNARNYVAKNTGATELILNKLI